MQVQEALARGRNVRPPTSRPALAPGSLLDRASTEGIGMGGRWRMEDGGCSVLGARCSVFGGGRWSVPAVWPAALQRATPGSSLADVRLPASGFPRPTSRVRLPASDVPRRPDPTAQSQQTKRQPRAVGSGRGEHAPPLPLPLPHAPIPTTYRVDASYVQCISSPTSTQCSALRRSRSARAGRFKRELLLKLFSGAAAGSSWPRLPPPRLRVQGSSGGRSTRAAGTRGSLRTTRLRSTSWRSTAWATRPRVSWPRCAPRTTSGSRET